MKLYHITSASAAASIARQGFNGKTQEREGAFAPWISKFVMGQQAQDVVSLTFGGIPSIPWREMVMAGQNLRPEELASIVVDLEPEEATRIFLSAAVSSWMGINTIHGPSLEVTAPRELVNQRIVKVIEGPPPMTGKTANIGDAIEGWLKAFSLKSVGESLVDSQRPEVQATELIMMWQKLGVPPGKVQLSSLVETDYKIRRALFRFMGKRDEDLLPAQKEILKKWGINL